MAFSYNERKKQLQKHLEKLKTQVTLLIYCSVTLICSTIHQVVKVELIHESFFTIGFKLIKFNLFDNKQTKYIPTNKQLRDICTSIYVDWFTSRTFFIFSILSIPVNSPIMKTLFLCFEYA